MRLMDFFRTQSDRRHAERVRIDGLTAYFWEGSGAVNSHPLLNVSETGACLECPQGWYPGTILMFRLQMGNEPHLGNELQMKNELYLSNETTVKPASQAEPMPVSQYAVENSSQNGSNCQSHSQSNSSKSNDNGNGSKNGHGKRKRAKRRAQTEPDGQTVPASGSKNELSNELSNGMNHMDNGNAGEIREPAQTPPQVPIEEPQLSTVIAGQIVHRDSGTIGVEFLLPDKASKVEFRRFLAKAKSSAENRKARSAMAGQSVVEFVLLMPLLMFLVINTVNWGGFIFAWITVANASRAAAEYAILDGASASTPVPATATQIQNLVYNSGAGSGDASTLPNRASLAVNICKNYNSTVTTVSGTCTGVPADPAPALYVLTSIDVTYTYKPFIPLFKFPGTGINLTLGNKTVHRRTQMRRLQ